MSHLDIMKMCDKFQDCRDTLLELDESGDAATLELLYQKYIKLYHEYIRS
jgi:hypothetical protein